MNLSFGQEYKYIVFEPVDMVRSQLKSITRTPWYDVAINLSGKVFDDNRFKLYSKMSMGIQVFGLIQDIVVITGQLESEHGKTNIHVKIGPSDLVLAAFYVISFIFLFEAISLFMSSHLDRWIMVVGLFFLLVFMRSLIYFSAGRLKNRFERIMLLHPEE